MKFVVHPLASAYDNKGYYLPNASATEKLPYFKKAITVQLGKSISNIKPFELPTIKEIQESGYEQDLLPFLIDLADHYIKAYGESHNKSYLQYAKDTFLVLDQLITLIRHDSSTTQSQLFWIEKGVDVYMLAVKTCYLLGDTTKAFYFMEKNKALLLQEQIKQWQVKVASNIPQTVIEKEQKLYYNLQQAQEQFKGLKNDTNRALYITQTHKAYNAFMDSIKATYPDYVKTKKEVNIIELKDIIADYSTKGTQFVEYILNEKEGYGIYYDLEQPQLFQIQNVSVLQGNLKSIQTLLKKRTMSPKDRTTYQSLGFNIFKTLFPFENAELCLKETSLVIIPDEALRYLPFEALPVHSDQDLFNSYFVQSTELSYLQSISLTKQLSQKQRHTNKKMLVIAPSSFKDKDLPELMGTAKSITHFKKYQNTTTLFGEAAKKDNFIKEQVYYQMIHFNTHAGIDTLTQKPWLAFYDKKMNLYEFYGRENQAKLVILDACKTSDGKQYAGEGVMNLSRGFFYNGTQSVLASLWKINETSGNQITQNFYTNLEQGYSTSKALQNAKITHLQQCEAHQKAPYYWATFILTGQADTIALPIKSNSLVYILITIGLLLAIFLFYKHHILKR